MESIFAPRSLIYRRMVCLKIMDICKEPDKDYHRPEVLALLRCAMSDGQLEIRRRFAMSGKGTVVVRETCYLMDQLIRIIYDYSSYSCQRWEQSDPLSLVAVGGYGRGELSPKSDIDLLFLIPAKTTLWHEKMTEHILYFLWDMGLKVGHSVRSLKGCITESRKDITIRTSLLDMRGLWGDVPLYDRLKIEFHRKVVAGTGAAFIKAKLAERDSRHEQMGDSRYVLEPNIKEGKGALRDLHTLYWIVKYIYGVSDMDGLASLGLISPSAAIKFNKAQAFLWTVRCHMHYLVGRQEDHLTFDLQPDVARRMGYSNRKAYRSVERFMRHFFLIAKDVGDLTRLICSLAEEQKKYNPLGLRRLLQLIRWTKKSGFAMDGQRLTAAFPKQFIQQPLDILAIFHVAQQQKLPIHPAALAHIHHALFKIRALRDDPRANALFLDILIHKNDPSATLRHMNDAGVLARFIPDFARVVGQMQFDMYHVYTVDEHLIRSVGIMRKIENGLLDHDIPQLSNICSKITSRRVLYVAILLHDIGKGRKENHSTVGAEIAATLCPRLGLSLEETETVVWLVRHHLDMSRIAFKRDLDDIKTITDFIELVQSPERLRLLLCLTVADIHAVGPKIWNSWKGTLLGTLFNACNDRMLGVVDDARRANQVVEVCYDLRIKLLAEGWTDTDISSYLTLGLPNYWLGFDLETLFRHAKLVRKAEKEGSVSMLDIQNNVERSASEITLYAQYHSGIFCKVAGAMALVGANIVNARINTFCNGMVLDSFHIQNSHGEAFAHGQKVKQLKNTLEKVLNGSLIIDLELEKKRRYAWKNRRDLFTVPPRVLIDNEASATHTLMEINGRDRLGLLYEITAMMKSLGVQISSAYISTYGERAVDVLYIKDAGGLKIINPRKLEQIREGILSVIPRSAQIKLQTWVSTDAASTD